MSDLSSNVLLPCPFCGGAAQFHGGLDDPDGCLGCHYIHCTGCGLMADFYSPMNNCETLDEERARGACSVSEQVSAETLLTCPWCDSSGAKIRGFLGWYSVNCENAECEASGPARKTTADAVAAWNDRENSSW